MPSAGEQMLLGIRLEMNAAGVVAGSARAKTALAGVRSQAKKTRGAVTAAAAGMGSALQEGMGIAAIGGAAMGVGLGLEKRFLTPAMNQAKDFQVEMKALGFVTNQAGVQMTRYRDEAIKTAKETQFTPVQAVEGMRWLRQSGLDNVQMLEALRPALDFATASMGTVGLADGAKLAATAMIKFQHEGRKTRSLMDAMAHSVRESKLQWEELPIVMNSLRIAPQIMHMTMEEALGLTGALRTAGATAAEAGENVNAFVQNLMINERTLERYLVRNKISWEKYQTMGADDLQKGRSFMRIRAMKRLGVEIFDAEHKLRKTSDIVRDMLKNMSRLSAGREDVYLRTVSSAFSAGGKNVLILLKDLQRGGKKGADAFDEMLANMQRNTGALRQAAAAYEATQRGMEVFIQGSKEGIQVILGGGLLPILWDLSYVLRKVVNVFLDYVMASPAFTKALGLLLVSIILVTKAVGAALLAFGAWRMFTYYIVPALASFGGWVGMITTGFGLLRTAAMRAMMVLKPMVGIFAIFWLLAKVWEKIWAEDATGPWKNIQVLLLQMKVQWDAFMGGIMDGIGGTLSVLVVVLETIYKLVMDIGQIIGKALGIEAFTDHVDSVKQAAEMWRFLGKMVGVFVVLHMASMALSVAQSTLQLLRFGRTATILGVAKLPMLASALGGVKLAVITLSTYTLNLARLLAGSLWFGLVNLVKLLNFMTLGTFPRLFLALKTWIFWLGMAIARHTVLAAQAIGGFLARIPLMLAGLGLMKISWIGVAAATWAALAPVLLIIAAIAAIVGAVLLIVHVFRKYGGAIMDAVVGWGGMIIDAFWVMVGHFRDLGVALWEGFVDGLKARFHIVIEALKWMAGGIRDFLPGSDAKVGPLSTLTDSGKALLTTMQVGVEEAAPSLHHSVGKSMGYVDSALVGGGGTGDSGPAAQTKSVSITVENMNFSIEKASPAEVESLAKQIIEKLRELADDDNEVSFA